MARTCGQNAMSRRYRRRVDIQTIALSTDGENTETISTLAANVPAEVLFRAGGERIRGGVEVVAEATHLIRMRHRTDLTSRMKIVDGSDTYNVVAYGDPTGERRELLIQAKQNVS